MRLISGPALRAFSVRYVISLGLAAALMAAGVVVVNRDINDRVSRIHRIKLAVPPAPPQGANFLIIGSDTRAFVDTPGDQGAFGDASAEGGQRSDTLMVAHVEPAAKRTFVLSFPRDLLVNIPGTAGKQKINAAYDLGGAQPIIDTLKANFDIDINHYLEVDFKSFRAIVDAIGTVPVYFPYPARDQLSGLNVAFGGCDQLDGNAALEYVRSRYLEFLENGRWTYVGQDAPDLYRIARQQQFIRELVGIAVNRSLGDPAVAVDVSDRVLQYLKADQNLSRSDVNALIRSFRTVDANNTRSLDMETVPVTPNPADPGSTLILKQPDADAMINRLRTFGDNTPAPPEVPPSSVKVTVLDGTGHGADTAGALRELQRLGFIPGTTSIGTAVVATTEIRYRPDLGASAKTLLDYVQDARLVPDSKLTGSTIELVLGQSFQAITVPPTTTFAPATASTATSTTTPPPSTTGKNASTATDTTTLGIHSCA